jgi:hypothetical protein
MFSIYAAKEGGDVAARCGGERERKEVGRFRFGRRRLLLAGGGAVVCLVLLLALARRWLPPTTLFLSVSLITLLFYTPFQPSSFFSILLFFSRLLF